MVYGQAFWKWNFSSLFKVFWFTWVREVIWAKIVGLVCKWNGMKLLNWVEICQQIWGKIYNVQFLGRCENGWMYAVMGKNRRSVWKRLYFDWMRMQGQCTHFKGSPDSQSLRSIRKRTFYWWKYFWFTCCMYLISVLVPTWRLYFLKYFDASKRFYHFYITFYNATDFDLV